MCSHCDGNEYRQVIAENVRQARKPFVEIFPARLEDSEGHDILQTYLERCAALRATRDSQAIRASNKNTLLLLDALRGHL